MDENLRPLPIVDKIIKDLHGRVVNYVRFRNFTLGKELQAHVAELKASTPFRSPKTFEETMYEAVSMISDFLERRYGGILLGLGMHPFLNLEEVKVWSHRDRQIYESLSKLFNLSQHGWLNIQSFQLNLPYSNEKEAVALHNALANLLPYIPAVSASSPLYESKIGRCVDNRLYFYMINQREIPSITGDVIPEYVGGFKEYFRVVIHKYSQDLVKANASKCVLNKEWINSRGAIFRFDRKAIEIRVMDEQECIKSDVALSCYIRAALRGFIHGKEPHLPHNLLVKDSKSVIVDGLGANVEHPRGPTARDVCRYYYKIAERSASSEEKEYLPIVGKRIEEGNLSEVIRRDVLKRAQKADLNEAIFSVYASLARNLRENRVYF